MKRARGVDQSGDGMSLDDGADKLTASTEESDTKGSEVKDGEVAGSDMTESDAKE